MGFSTVAAMSILSVQQGHCVVVIQRQCQRADQSAACHEIAQIFQSARTERNPRYSGKRSPTISSLLRHKSLAWARLSAYERTPTREFTSSFTSHTWQSSQ